MTRRLVCCALLASILAGAGARRLGAGQPPGKPAPPGAVPMVVRTVGMDPAAGAPIVVLETAGKDRCLLIIIGPAEAVAIARPLHDAPPLPRPMTHDLLGSVLTRLGGTLTRIVITRLADNTFYAELVVQQGRALVRIDARPSDAMALALRAKAPILVAREVLDKAGLEPGQLPDALKPRKKPPSKPPSKDKHVI